MNNQDATGYRVRESRATVLSMSVEANTEPESASHTRSFVQRDFICPPQTANPSAFMWPMRTTSRFRRVTPVYGRFRSDRGVKRSVGGPAG